MLVVDDARRPFALETACCIANKIRVVFVPYSCQAVGPRSLVHYKTEHKKSRRLASDPLLDSFTIYGMNLHPTATPACPTLASPLFDASFESIESHTTTFTSSVVPTLETTTVTEVALGYHRNQHYSITAMTTSTGAVAERYAYTAYGQPTILNASGTVLTSSAVGNRYTYTGREWDETLGIYHFRARWMSPLAGRFLGRDPIGYLDTYALYDLEIALSALDPTGNSPSGPSDIDVMFTCLQSNYTQLSVNVANRPGECPYLPLGILEQGRFVQLVNNLGVGVILSLDHVTTLAPLFPTKKYSIELMNFLDLHEINREFCWSI